MGISIIDNFDYRAGKPNFTRDLFATIEEMRDFPTMYLPEVFEANVVSTGDRYRYNINNEDNPLTGKWRLVESGSGSNSGYSREEIDDYMALKLDKPSLEGTEGQFLSLNADGENVFVDLPQYDDTELRELIEDIQLGNLSYEIVTQLPDNTLQTVNKDTVYMIPTDGDIYNMFLFVDDKFVSLGSTTGGDLTGPVDASSVVYSNIAMDTVTNIKDCLDALIAKIYYVAPSITSFTCSPSRLQYELGEKITSVTFNWSYNKNITNQTLTDCDVSDISVRTATYESEITSNKTFILSCGDGQNSASSSKAFTFSNKIHHGSSAIPSTYDSTFIFSLPGQLKSSKSGGYSAVVGANQYFYIAMPSTYNSNADVLMVKLGGFDTELSRVASFDHENASGYITNYSIYKSTNSNLGNISATI